MKHCKDSLIALIRTLVPSSSCPGSSSWPPDTGNTRPQSSSDLRPALRPRRASANVYSANIFINISQCWRKIFTQSDHGLTSGGEDVASKYKVVIPWICWSWSHPHTYLLMTTDNKSRIHVLYFWLDEIRGRLAPLVTVLKVFFSKKLRLN